MSAPAISDEELNAFIDGELAPARAVEVARALDADARLSARAQAFRQDRDVFAAAYAPVARAALPAAWLARIEQAVEKPASNVVPFPPRPAAKRPGYAYAWAAAACVALMLGWGALQLRPGPPPDSILAQAALAQSGRLAASAHFADSGLPAPEMQRELLSRATGLPVKAPDLRRLGWHLASMDLYRGAAALHYANAKSQALSVFVRRSAGAPRFDILKQGTTRVCVWQDEVVGAVMMGDMSAGQMMRVAGAAYADLDM
jgi:anti-sigma factor RsiW